MQGNTPNSIWLWRASEVEYDLALDCDSYDAPERRYLLDPTGAPCRWCGARQIRQCWSERGEVGWSVKKSVARCPQCGWWSSHDVASDAQRDLPYPRLAETTIGLLREFDLQDEAVAPSEFGSFVRRNPSVIEGISPRRFERLVADTFGQEGLHVVLTKQTSDGGVDVVVIDPSREHVLLVECKHTRTGRVIGVGAVRQLVGASIDWQHRHALLVTNSRFSQPAVAAAHRFRDRGLEVSLADADELMRMLEVYDESQPRLTDLRASDLADIETANRRVLEAMSIDWWKFQRQQHHA